MTEHEIKQLLKLLLQFYRCKKLVNPNDALCVHPWGALGLVIQWVKQYARDEMSLELDEGGK